MRQGKSKTLTELLEESKYKNISVVGDTFYIRLSYPKGTRHKKSTGLQATKANLPMALTFKADYDSALRDEERYKSGDAIRPMPFREGAGPYLEHMRNKHYDRPSSYERIRSSFASLREHFDMKLLADITKADLDRYVTMRRERKIRKITIKHDLVYLGAFFRWAMEPDQNWMEVNPVVGYQKPTPDNGAMRPAAFESSDLRIWSEIVQPWPNVADLTQLMLHHGCRPEEFLKMKRSQIDMVNRAFYIKETDAIKGKTAAFNRDGNALEMTDETYPIFKRRVEAHGTWLFPSELRPAEHSRAIPSHRIMQQIRRAFDARKQEIADQIAEQTGTVAAIVEPTKVCVYDFRHLYGTRSLKPEGGSMDLATLKVLMGHAHLSSTLKYLNTNKETVRRAQADARKAFLNEARQGIHAVEEKIHA